jgi:hypothetical protein
METRKRVPRKRLRLTRSLELDQRNVLRLCGSFGTRLGSVHWLFNRLAPALDGTQGRRVTSLSSISLDATRISTFAASRLHHGRPWRGLLLQPDMIVRQANDVGHRTPRLLHFALPIRPRDGRVTARQVRSTGLGLLLLSAWFLVAAFMGIFGHH